MKLNPYLSALSATAYICLIALFFNYLEKVRGNTPDSFVDPIGALSLLVFSVAFMALIFFYKPVVLLIENKKIEAISYFTKTLVTFGLLTFVVFASIIFIN